MTKSLTRFRSHDEMLVVATHIDSAFLISSFFILSRYLAIRMPAGHNMPPHPAARSSCKRSGGSRSPPKSTDLMLAGMCSGDLTKSSPKARNSCSGDGEREAIEGDMVSMMLSLSVQSELFFVWLRVQNSPDRWTLGSRLPCRCTKCLLIVDQTSHVLSLRDKFWNAKLVLSLHIVGVRLQLPPSYSSVWILPQLVTPHNDTILTEKSARHFNTRRATSHPNQRH